MKKAATFLFAVALQFANASPIKIGLLETNSGKEFKDATVTLVDRLTVKVAHESGVSRIAVIDLPASTQKQ